MKKRYLMQKISILSIALLLTSTYALSAIVPFLQSDFSISKNLAENLISMPSLFILIMTLLSEKITYKIGMKNCVISGLTLIFISGIFPLFFKSLPAIFISRILLGIGIGFFCAHSANYINLFYEGLEKENLQGIRNSMEYVGQIVLLLLAGFLIKINYLYSFLIYSLAILILILFYKNVEDVRLENKKNKFSFNKNLLLFMLISSFCIMDITAMTVKFAEIAQSNLGKNINVSSFLSLIPVVGMVSGFFYGKFYQIFGKNTVSIGLIIYVIANIVISYSANNFYLFLSQSLLVTLAQSMVMPYMFSNASNLLDKTCSQFATNMIFVSCNLGAFLAALVINSFSKIINSQSLTLGFLIFSIFASVLLIFYRKFTKKS